MLTIMLPADGDQEAVEIHLEHSLASLSKWESFYEKAFFSTEEKTEDETNRYIQLMLRSPDIQSDFVDRLKQEHYTAVSNYINKPNTATTFSNPEPQGRARQEPITAELVYYWMIGFQIPFFPCEDWPFNRVMTLIRIAGIKQTKPRRMSKAAQAEEMRRLNAQRREKLNTPG